MHCCGSILIVNVEVCFQESKLDSVYIISYFYNINLITSVKISPNKYNADIASKPIVIYEFVANQTVKK